jgi:glucokinase
MDAPAAPMVDVATYLAADYGSLEAAMERYLHDGGKPTPAACAIGIANPVTGDRVQMTNHDWSFSIEEVRRRFGFGRLLVINDFTALALALPALGPDDTRRIGGADPVPLAPVALIGPGTGLGVSGLLPVPRGGGWVPLMGEGGHVTLCGTDAEEDAVIAHLRRRFGHASAERALSGPGLVALHEAVCEVHGRRCPAKSASEVTGGTDADSVAAVQMFLALLGSVAGNLALTLGARGGVYIGGGIVPRLAGRIDGSRLRQRFESKGRFRAFLEPIPILLVTSATSPALTGASQALDHL